MTTTNDAPITDHETLQQMPLPDALAALLGKQKKDGWHVSPVTAAAAVRLVLSLRYNELTHLIEADGKPLGSYDLDNLYLELAGSLRIIGRKEMIRDAAILVAQQSSYHPVVDYLKGCRDEVAPLFDDDWDHIAERCFRLDPDQDVAKANKHLRNQIIGAAARVWLRDRPEPVKLDTVATLVGKQGAFKSTFWRTLAGSRFFSDSLSDQSSTNDEKLALHSAWIHEYGEIDSVFGRKEAEAQKRFLSAVEDLVRRPYGRSHETLRRCCAIVGTSNSDSFIKDSTGNRRFPVIRVESADLEWTAEHRDAIWARAIAEVEAGTRWWYTAEECEEVSRDALEFVADDPIREQVETFLVEHQITEPIALTELIRRVFGDFSDIPNDTKQRNRVINVLKSLGWARGGKKAKLPVKQQFGEAKMLTTWPWIPPTVQVLNTITASPILQAVAPLEEAA